MLKVSFIKLGYLNNLFEKTIKPLSAERLENLMTSSEVNSIMTQIEAEADEDKKSKLKEKLPCALYQCQMPADGMRPTADTAIASGFCMHDWDKMDVDPAVFYWQNVSGREDELGIVFVHITPRGKGLRLVTTMKPGELISQCQERIASVFKMEKYADRKIKDLSRISFLPSKKYVLFLNEKALFEQETIEVEDVQEVKEVKDDTSKAETTPATATTQPTATTQIANGSSEEGNTQSPSQGKDGVGPIAESFSYEGIKYSAIIEALLKRIATQGKPQEGERNDDLFILVRELRHICDYSFNTILMLVAPYFKTLPENEIRRTISSAIATNGRTITPVLRGVLNELKNQDVEVSGDNEGLKLAKLPKLSAIEEMILSKYPKHLRSQVFMSMLPIWGVYGTHIRFVYLDGRVNSLSFMTSIVGKSGSGKAFAANLYKKMTPRLEAQDAEERLKANQYLAACEKNGESTEKPDDPRPKVRLYGDDITTSQLLDYLDNIEGVHGLQFTEEVARLQKAKRTIYGDNDDLYCKAFDNAIGGKESKSKLTRNIRIPIYLNTLFCGTPGAMHKFYNNPEGGLNNRIIYAFMPKVRIKGFPHYDDLTADEEKQLDEVLDRLEEAGKDGKMVTLPWLEKTILKIKSKYDKEDDENPNEVWYDLGKRAMVVAMRVGVLEWFLRGCPEDKKLTDEISKVVRWTADSMRLGVYAFSGKEYEEIAETDNAYQEQVSTRMTKNKKLFSLLPTDFTTQDVVALRVQNGDNANVRMVLSRWMSDGLILSDKHGHYHKVNAPVA